ncbi:hypothetical protein DNK59_07515 [Pseudomonas sp. TKO26]|uniref:hypothetical protein n=1 Tax=unclassified Pseudomonas TaxID=196821 RepID=UPI000D8268EE|nr:MULTISPECIES: hypothetical protein [unclassified Pseudomonas]PYY88552.1 hypothetical protein DNK62_07515 [Pseudomonas sp. TKO30]PYY91412.1 hypothetical protein DNK61_07515 [Pseudomonas sp. TKO29]PYY94067.1 hypothetical protein DNK59_07515 [Pseudomonas sp. TKO26]PYZ00781.1 hypothetical protein DNK60_07515 [Pseudomonas sp. TKO14]
MIIKNAICISLSLLMTGCINFTSPARSSKLQASSSYWFDYDASRRGAFLVPDGTKIKICAEPPPDVALSLVSKLEADVKKDGIGEASGKTEFNTTVVKLVERTQMTMLLRESLYRLCEQSLGQDFTPAEILKAYEDTVKTAADIAKADLIKAQESLVKSETVQTLVKQGKSPVEIQEFLKHK